jgi:polar amino acid transport system substrate-binding protein
LAVNSEQLTEIETTYQNQRHNGATPFLTVGFNRRFAPLTQKMVQFFANRHEPMFLHARINAGFIPKDSWIQRDGDGGRIVGEFCHFIDWVRFVAASPIVTVSAAALPDREKYNHDNIGVLLTFQDGSIANLLYLANGDRSVPKEYFEIFCGGSVARLDDFKSLQLSRNRKTEKVTSSFDKGHRCEIESTIEAMKNGSPAPIPFEQLLEVTRATFAVEEALRTQRVVSLSDFVPRSVFVPL